MYTMTASLSGKCHVWWSCPDYVRNMSGHVRVMSGICQVMSGLCQVCGDEDRWHTTCFTLEGIPVTPPDPCSLPPPHPFTHPHACSASPCMPYSPLAHAPHTCFSAHAPWLMLYPPAAMSMPNPQGSSFTQGGVKVGQVVRRDGDGWQGMVRDGGGGAGTGREGQGGAYIICRVGQKCVCYF